MASTLLSTEQTDVTPDFCFQKAAEVLLTSSADPGEKSIVASEWRLLGQAIADDRGTRY